MTLDVERARVGRRPFWVVEIDLDYCSLSYGVAPCTAAVGVTGTAKCFNTRATCQDTANYDGDAAANRKTYRFCSNVLDLPRDLDALPLVESVSISPQRLAIGSGLGERGGATVVLRDGLHNDVGVDKYVAERSYNPLQQGTVLGRLLARNRYFLGRRMRVFKGYLTTTAAGGTVFDFANAEERLYFLEKAEGPAGGAVTITAKDVLKFADDDRAQAPRPAQGRLSAALTAAATSATLLPAGIGTATDAYGDLLYPATGKVRINSEVMSYTRSGDVLTLTRAQHNTVAAEHASGDAVQPCLEYSGQPLDAIVSDLLTRFARVPAEFIPTADWQSERSLYTSSRLYNAIITSPEGVSSLINELCEVGPAYFFWDEIEQEVVYRALRGASSAALTLTDDSHFLADSVKVQTRLDLRISEVAIFFGQRDPTEPLDKLANYQVAVFKIGGGGTAEKYGQARSKIITSRWLDSTARTFAEQVADALLQRYDDAPRQIDGVLVPKDAGVTTASLFRASTMRLQGVDGLPESVVFQTTARGENQNDQIPVSALEERFSADATVGARIINFSAAQYLDVDLRQAHDAQYTPPTGPVTVTFVVEANTILGSSDAAIPACDSGSWPPGSDIKLALRGRLQGKGGKGGAGAAWSVNPSFQYPPGNGEDGGTALRARFPLTVDCSSGSPEIFGGGGGGGGGESWATSNNAPRGGGGGGGAGTLPGTGGPTQSAGQGGIPQYAAAGSDGTETVGGAGGQPDSLGTENTRGGYGGAGGGIGEAGAIGEETPRTEPLESGQGAPGAAGNAIDGLSYITFIGSADIRGPQIN